LEVGWSVRPFWEEIPQQLDFWKGPKEGWPYWEKEFFPIGDKTFGKVKAI